MTLQTNGSLVTGVAPPRTGKKMRKRRELDALVGYAGGAGGRRAAPLLAGSSDERDEWGGSLGGGMARGRRGGRSSCAPAARACAALLLCACATATATVVWLFVDVREQITALRSEMELVSMGSQGVGDALQRCHSVARELQHNHTEMAARLDKLILRADNLTSQVATMQIGLASVKEQLASTPELVSMPQQLSALGASVARFGSQIKDLDSTVTALRAQSAAVSDGQALLHHNVTELKVELDQVRNKSMSGNEQSNGKQLAVLLKQQTDLQGSISQLSTNLTLINETLGTKINWATQDFQRDHHKVTGLLESVQNNSAALSSLQTAWKESNAIISRNITQLTQKVADKSSEIQRQALELKQLKEQLATAQAKQLTDLPIAQTPTNTNVVPGAVEKLPADAPLPAADTKSMHERDSGNIYDIPKILPSSPTPTSETTKVSQIIARSATGKPSILSSSGSG